jgi:rhamnogalacturonan acetylesterase
MGQEAVKPLFPNEHTHTAREGAAINANSIVKGIKGLKNCELKKYIL